MGVKKVIFYEFSRLNMVYTLLSKRKLLWFVQNGRVDGWDDPRMPIIQGMVRRGLKIEALKQFILEQVCAIFSIPSFYFCITRAILGVFKQKGLFCW